MALNRAGSLCWSCSLRRLPYKQIYTQPRRVVHAQPNLWLARNVSVAAASKAKAEASAAPPNSSSAVQPEQALDAPSSASMTKSIAQGLRNKAPGFTETYVAYGVCEQLVKECVRVADYAIPQANNLSIEIPRNEKGEDIGVGDSWWYTRLGMTPTFNTWAQITFLHMYLLTVRLRGFEHAKTWHQHLADHFFQLAEDRMILLHRLNSRMIRNRYLKELYNQWRGLNAAYDEGLVRGDAILASAVWRNICKGDEHVDLQRLAEIVSYIRSVLASFDSMPDEVLAKGDVVFGDPSSEEAVVQQLSHSANVSSTIAFTKTPAKVIKKK